MKNTRNMNKGFMPELLENAIVGMSVMLAVKFQGLYLIAVIALFLIMLLVFVGQMLYIKFHD